MASVDFKPICSILSSMVGPSTLLCVKRVSLGFSFYVHSSLLCIGDFSFYVHIQFSQSPSILKQTGFGFLHRVLEFLRSQPVLSKPVYFKTDGFGFLHRVLEFLRSQPVLSKPVYFKTDGFGFLHRGLEFLRPRYAIARCGQRQRVQYRNEASSALLAFFPFGQSTDGADIDRARTEQIWTQHGGSRYGQSGYRRSRYREKGSAPWRAL